MSHDDRCLRVEPALTPDDSVVDVLGVPVGALNLPAAVAAVDRMVRVRAPGYVCVTGVHGVMEAQRDDEVMRAHQDAALVTPDGMPLVWLGRRAGAKWMDRVYGPDLLLEVCRHGAAFGWRHYLYGAAPGVADAMAAELRRRVPGVDVVGAESPPFRPLTDADADELAARLRELRVDVLWVGLSTPKQELLMHRFHRTWGVPVSLGVGAAFDFYAGTVRQAPRWIQRSGLEWAFRLAAEPRRLWRRYLRNNPAFVVAVARRRPRLRLRGAPR